jgi:transketolase
MNWPMELQRQFYSKALIELGKEDTRVVVVGADTTGSLQTDKFGKEFPGRLFNVGISEQNMICVAAGLALSGKIAFASTFASFGTALVYNQIRQSIAYPNIDVKIVCSHAGLTVGPDGATHQMIEDVGLMCGLPNMKVIVPADAPQAYHATKAMKSVSGPLYMRLSRGEFPSVTSMEQRFELGKAQVIREGKDVCLIANGLMLSKCIEAAEELKKERVDAAVLNVHTVKPIDADALIRWAESTGAVVTAEEHTIIHGLGSQVASVLSEHCPVPIKMVGVKDKFGESGAPEQLLDKHGLTVKNIVASAKDIVGKKR